MAKLRLLEIFDREEKSLLRQIEMMSRGELTTHSNGNETTQESLDRAQESLRLIREARTLLV